MSVDTKEQQKNSGDYISRFEIRTKLGSGGMGIVYKAFDPLLNKTVGLKVLRAKSLTPEGQARFQQEAKSIKDLRHPSIPEIYNFAISEQDEPYIVMEYVEGKSLKSWLDEGTKFSINEIKEILVKTAEALSYAHKHHVIHRDIKPDNIIVTKLDEGGYSIKLIDFGLAKLEEDLSENQDMTQTGVIVGSPPYMSPEQIRGQKTSSHSDIYSFGCVFYELMCNSPPYLGDTPLDTVSKHLAEPINICLAKIPDQFKDTVVFEIIETCINKDPNQRYDSALLLKEKLEEIVDPDVEVSAPLINLEIPEAQPSNTKQVVLIGIALTSLVAVAATTFSILSDKLTQVESVPKKESAEISGNIEKTKWKYMPKKGYGHWYADVGVNDQDFQLLSNKTHCNQITCIESDTITGAGLLYLRGMPISTITISSRALNDPGVENAALFPNLSQFYIEQCTKVSAKPFLKFKDLKQLRRLGVKGSTITPGVIENISKLSSLESLSLRASTPVTAKDMQMISQLKNLNTLILDGTGIPKSSIKEIAKLPNLKRLSVESLNLTDQDVAQIAKLKLSLLDLSDNPITQKSLRYLKQNKYLKIIGLIHCTNIANPAKKSFKLNMKQANGCEVHLDTTYNPFNSENYPLLD